MSGTPQQYCLRWNNYQNNLTNVFDQLLQSEAFVDVTLACDGDSVKAHKMILSACSPYFQQLFFEHPCSHPIVILKDVKWEELKAVVEFMYRGEINVSQEQLAPLLKVAELLKIRGLADVSRGSSADFVSAASAGHKIPTPAPGTSVSSASASIPNNPALLLQSSPHLIESDGEGSNNQSRLHRRHTSSSSSLHHHLQHPHQFHHHNNPALLLQQQYANVAANGHVNLRSRRKRRKLSTLSDDNISLSPSGTLDDDNNSSNQLEIDDDYDPSSPTMGLLEAGLLVGPTSTHSTPALLPSSMGAAANSGHLNSTSTTIPSTQSSSSSSSHNSMAAPASLLSLHNAALAAAANVTSSSSSAANDMDLKPGIREMIREEERAKMLESSHGWLGPSGASALSDSYQYQIQSLWQKCWSTNQSGMVQALRFRERGPLKSWRPETMADAIFAVLREGLSLSQAARKYDIPYPTFVLYANRVHNMLGPSSDGSSDLLSDMRPKGRGRPQRILLGSWPEDHIHSVIRAVVFRDATKDDLPFGFGRDLCIQPQPGSSHTNSNNGLDMSINAPFLGLHHHHHHRSGPSSSFGSSNESNNSLNLGGLKVRVELGNHALSRSNSPLLDGLGGSNQLPLDVLREQREQAILRAMKKSGDDDEDELDDDEEDDSRTTLRTILEERHLNNSSRNTTQLIANDANRKAMENTNIQQQNENMSPELIHIKTEVSYDENDQMDDEREEDGLLIHETESDQANLDDPSNDNRECSNTIANHQDGDQEEDEDEDLSTAVVPERLIFENNNSSNENTCKASTTTIKPTQMEILNKLSSVILVSESLSEKTAQQTREINTPSPQHCSTNNTTT